MGMSNSICMKYNETLRYFKNNPNDTQFSLLIIDMDFDNIENLTPLALPPVIQILKQLIQENNWISDIPTLCVVNNCMKRSRKKISEELEVEFSSSAILHPQGSRDPAPTPQEEQSNPFDINSPNSTPQSPSAALLTKSLENALNDKLHMSITKPFKNSRLLHILHELLSTEQGFRPSYRKQRLGSLGSANTRHSLRGALTSDNNRRLSQNSTTTTAQSEQKDHKEEHRMDDLGSINNTLVVDDNPVNLKILSCMLSQIGISSTTSSNGGETYEVIKEASTTLEPYQLLFMDIWMSELNGLEAAQKIRADAAQSSTERHIIALTACVMSSNREKYLVAGMNVYVNKPVRKEELDRTCLDEITGI